MHTCEYHPFWRQIRRRIRAFFRETLVPLLLSGLVHEQEPKRRPRRELITPYEVRRNFSYIMGEQRIQELRNKFQETFVDRLRKEDREAVINFVIDPFVFVLTHEREILADLWAFDELWRDMHNFCEYPMPYNAWIIVSLDAEKADPKLRHMRGTWNGMNVFYSMKKK